MKSRANKKLQHMEIANGNLVSDNDVDSEAVTEKRKQVTGPEMNESFRTIEPFWEGQWMILKYL